MDAGQKNRKLSVETEFFGGLIELQYGQDVEEKLRELSAGVPWANNWPEDKKSFWNAEAFMWGRKIDKVKREMIRGELSFLQGKNLDLGCGAYSYIPSVGFDISEKMLLLNENCVEKVTGDLETKLPFEDSSFDSVTSVFVLNYVKDYNGLLSEITRVLREKGVFMAVLSSTKVNEWQRQKEINIFSAEKWKSVLESHFNVQLYYKEKLWFFKQQNSTHL